LCRGFDRFTAPGIDYKAALSILCRWERKTEALSGDSPDLGAIQTSYRRDPS
jgi:hypothetical protein